MKIFHAPIEEELRKMQDNAKKTNEKLEDVIEEADKNLEEEEKKEEIIEKNDKSENFDKNIIKNEAINVEKTPKKIENPENITFYSELQALKGVQLKIIPIFEDIEKIYEKKKFQGFFNIIVLGLIHSGYIKKNDICKILKKNAEIYIENTKFLVPLQPKDRDSMNGKITECGKNLNFIEKSFDKGFYKRFSYE